MVYAFDLDDTISARAELFKPLMYSLCSLDGVSVYVVSAFVRGSTWPFATREQKKEQLAKMGILQGEHYDDLYVALGGGIEECGAIKRQILDNVEADFYMDDNPVFAQMALKPGRMVACCAMGKAT